MPLIRRLPRKLENGEALLKRRAKAAAIKEFWRDHYRECYEYTMPERETFQWYAPGQRKNRHLYESTGQRFTKLAASNAIQLLCPSWKHWSILSPGADIDPEQAESLEVIDALQEATTTVFGYLNHSNFSTEIPMAFQDLMIGTTAMSIEETDDPQRPFVCNTIPLSVIELEEGPNGLIETTFMCRKPLARNLMRTYRGMQESDLPSALIAKINKAPDEPVEVIECKVYHPDNGHYYGIAVHSESKAIIWRWDYEDSNPVIVARASVISGEIYGRGRVMAALPDIKTLNSIMEFVLRHAAMQVAPPLTGVSDGVLNPYTAELIPNSIIPVASNDNGNPSLRVLEFGGNFAITSELIQMLRDSVREMLMGADRSDGPIKSATEVSINDRNRLWDMGAEFGRLQAELLQPIIARVVWILQKRGKVPPIKVDGRQVTLKYVSPLARAQDQEDLIALDQSLDIAAKAATVAGEAGIASMAMGFKLDNLPAWLAKRTGLDADLLRSESEKRKLAQAAQEAAQAAQGQQGGMMQGAAPGGAQGMGAGNMMQMMRRAA